MQVKKVREYMKDSKFTVDDIKSISTAGAGLLKWVFAMVNYNSVARTVDPKRKKVAESEKNLRLAQKELAKIKVSLCVCACAYVCVSVSVLAYKQELHIASLS